jgi:hypothetical protein
VNAYTADRWQLFINLDTASVGVTGASDTTRAQAGDESVENILYDNFTGNAGAAAYSFIMQKIEDVYRLAGKTVTVSFYATSTPGTLKLGVSLSQNFGTGGSPSGAVNTSGQAIQLTGVISRYSVTFTAPSVAGKTVGTNKDSNTQLNLWCSCGTTNAALAGNIGVQSGSIYLWGVQLEIGSTATPLEKPDPQQDLAKCMRFYQVGHINAQFYGAAGGGSNWMIYMPAWMRANPTITVPTPSLSNCTGFSTGVWNAAQFHVAATVTALGTASVSGDYTASADL